jgi:hypothetical protein
MSSTHSTPAFLWILLHFSLKPLVGKRGRSLTLKSNLLSTAARSALGSGSHSQLFEASRMLGKDVLSYILKHQLYGTTFSEPESIGLENE